MSTSALESLQDHDTLPPLPYVAHEILLAANREEPDIAEVSDKLAREPGLSARVVAMANSAFFAGQQPLYSIQHAIMRLGLVRVRVLAASVLLNKLFDPGRCPAFSAPRYWHDAIATSYTATRLAPHLAPSDTADAAYISGLLHNIGLLLLVHFFPGPMNKVLGEYGRRPEQSLVALTRSALGCDHGEAGRLLLKAWELPEPVVAVASHFHSPHYRGEHAELVHLVRHAAEWHEAGFELPEAHPLNRALPAAVRATEARHCQRETERLAAFARLLA
ncbi:HDOD domain-containing protein [Alkalilimnicola ehrlichii]|uniref:HDOD domain-containing protein n=1 Tax=Alkalilimnicola ehrlichii TaxID=351052 RepID=UPI003BA0B8BB